MITNKKSNSSISDATTRSSLYKICDKTIMFDNPHYYSQNLSEKLVFQFSNILLNNLLLVFDLKSRRQLAGENEI